MKLDLLDELQIPKPHHERSELRCFQQALQQIELADRVLRPIELFGKEIIPHFRD